MLRVKKLLSESKPDDVDLFTKNVQAFVKDVLANFKEYQLFCGSYILLNLIVLKIRMNSSLFFVKTEV